jgi:hypothetical protein
MDKAKIKELITLSDKTLIEYALRQQISDMLLNAEFQSKAERKEKISAIVAKLLELREQHQQMGIDAEWKQYLGSRK